MSHSELLGWCASALMLCSYFCKGACRSRTLAVATNVAFIAYACSAAAPFVLIAHLMLLPINAVRLGSLLAKRHQLPIDRSTQTLR
jgi:hypothetical protein